jgi:hypothetical protein
MAPFSIFLLCLRVHAALWGHYKLYESKGDMLYDFTGNANHAQVTWSGTSPPILTDRGQRFEETSYIDFPKNIYKDYPNRNTMIIVMWVFVVGEGYLITVESGSHKIYLYWMGYNGNLMIKFHHSEATGCQTSIKFGNIKEVQWNLLVFHLQQGAADTQADVYEASGAITRLCSKTYSGVQINNPSTTWSINKSADNTMTIFLYEIWWLDDIVASIQNAISSLSTVKASTLISPISLSPFETYNGIKCDTECKKNDFSCTGDSTTCIDLCGSGCVCGCYRLSGIQCLTCSSVNCLTLNNSDCSVCRAGYYLDTSNICVKCPSDGSSCSSCTGILYLLNSNCVADCGLGKYKDTSNNMCVSCPAFCTECLNQNECTSCVENANITGGVCTCDNIYKESNGTCIDIGVLGASAEMDKSGNISLEFTGDLNFDLTSSYITFTIKGITYSSPSFSISSTNRKKYDITLNNIPLGDSSEITLNFIDPSSIEATDGSLISASTLIIEVPGDLHCITNCKICNTEDRTSRCEACDSGYYIINHGKIDECITECPISYYEKVNEGVGICKRCKDKCAICTEGNSCNRCEETYYMYGTSCLSECPSGYFHNEIDQKCTSCDIKNCSSCKYDNESSQLLCTECVKGTEPQNIDNEMKCEEGVNDQFNNSSSNNSGSDTSSQADYLARDSDAQELASQGSTASSSITTIAAAMSFSSTAGLWNLVNTIQLLSVLPLLNIELPIMLFATLISMRSYNPIPNIMSYIMPEKGPRPFRRASLLGYETSQFFINIGDILTTLSITLVLLPILIVIKKILPDKYHQKFIGKKVKQYIQGYKWNVFTRFYIECYIELAIAAAVQIFAMKDISDYKDFNIDINIIFAVLILVISI